MSKSSREKLERLIKESLLQICKSNIQSLCEVDGIICISIQDSNSEPEQLVIRIHENMKTSQSLVAHHKNVPYNDPYMRNKVEILSSDQASALKLYLSSSSSSALSSSSILTERENRTASPRLGFTGMRPVRHHLIINNNNAHPLHSGILTQLVKRQSSGNIPLTSATNNNNSSHSYVFNLSTNRDRNPATKLNNNLAHTSHNTFSNTYSNNNNTASDLSIKQQKPNSTTSNTSSSSTTFACGLCLHSFSTYDSLEVHFSSFHSSTLTHFCDDCNIGFECEFDCLSHRSNVHKAHQVTASNSVDENKNINDNNDANNNSVNNKNARNVPYSDCNGNRVEENWRDNNNNNKEDDDDSNTIKDNNNNSSNNNNDIKSPQDNINMLTTNNNNSLIDDNAELTDNKPSSPATTTTAAAITNSRRKQSNPKKGIMEWDQGQAAEDLVEREDDDDDELDEDDDEEDDEDDDDYNGGNGIDGDSSVAMSLKMFECNNNLLSETNRNVVTDSHDNNNKASNDINKQTSSPIDTSRHDINNNINVSILQQATNSSIHFTTITPHRHQTSILTSTSPSSLNNNDSTLKCPLCPESFATFLNLEDHCYVEHRKYLCNICPMTFSQKVTKDRHIYQQHAGNKPFPCQDCDSSFTRRDALRKHQVKCCHGLYRSGSSSNRSNSSNNNSGSGSSLVATIGNNPVNGGEGNRDGPLKIIIQKSGIVDFSNNANMISLINRSVLKKEANVSEDKIGGVVVDYSKLTQKILTSGSNHNNNNEVGEDCGLDLSRTSLTSSPSRSNFMNISRRLVTGGSTAPSLLPPQQYDGSESVMVVDDEIHLQQTPNKVTTMTPPSYHSFDANNINSNNNNNIMTSTLSASLPASPSSQAACTTKQYTCDKCELICDGAIPYKEHCRLVHRRTPCLHCGKTFSQKGNMERHRRQHTGERPFSCTICSCSYTRRETLKSHMSQAHGIKLMPQMPNSSSSSTATSSKVGGVKNISSSNTNNGSVVLSAFVAGGAVGGSGGGGGGFSGVKMDGGDALEQIYGNVLEIAPIRRASDEDDEEDEEEEEDATFEEDFKSNDNIMDGGGGDGGRDVDDDDDDASSSSSGGGAGRLYIKEEDSRVAGATTGDEVQTMMVVAEDDNSNNNNNNDNNNNNNADDDNDNMTRRDAIGYTDDDNNNDDKVDEEAEQNDDDDDDDDDDYVGGGGSSSSGGGGGVVVVNDGKAFARNGGKRAKIIMRNDDNNNNDDDDDCTDDDHDDGLRRKVRVTRNSSKVESSLR